MDREEIKRNITKYIVEFLEVPHEEFGGFPPCPFARAERLKNKLLIDVYDSSEGPFTDKIQEMIESGYESGVFALLENNSLVSLEEEETRSFQKFLNKNLKENGLGTYKTICINPKDELEVKGIKVRALSPYFLINVGLRKVFGKTHKSLKNSKYFENFPDYYKKYLNV
tara:strand:- start:590 stop:1096 length:507 start_codon:yes stop_codon:yes gene_type:complete